MQIILMTDVQRLGKTGDVVSVKKGYGRNFLIPQGLAVEADPKRIKALEHLKKLAAQRAEKEQTQIQHEVDRLETLSLTFVRQVSEEGKLFGSVTNLDIEEELANMGLEIERRKIILPDPIKSLGEYQVPVKLAGDRQANLKLSVVAPQAEEE
ncbi:MAG: 50S ribosomal protein L9 [Thermodesulfobacteriota bacterium]